MEQVLQDHGTSHSFHCWNQVPDDKKQLKGRRVCSGSPFPDTLFIMKGSSRTQMVILHQSGSGEMNASAQLTGSLHPVLSY